MFQSITVRTAQFTIPMDVQELMSVPVPFLTFKFLDPVECLIRLLTTGALSADMDNLAFKPRLQHGFYEDFVDGERLKRVYAALRSGTFALTSVLFFDSINRDKKGSYYGQRSLCTFFYVCFDLFIDVCFDVCFDVSFDFFLWLCFLSTFLLHLSKQVEPVCACYFVSYLPLSFGLFRMMQRKPTKTNTATF